MEQQSCIPVAKMRAAMAALLGGVCLLAAGMAAAQTTGKNPSHEDILRGFDISALYADTAQGTTGFGSGATLTGVVVRWENPIVYSLDGLQYDKARIAETVETLKKFADLAGIVVKEGAVGGKDVNFRIVFRNTDNLRASNGGKVGCLTSWNSDNWTGRLNWAELQINLAYQAGISQCIQHELLHAFGLRGHPHKLHSILSYYTTRFVFEPTEADIVLLQTLYDRRIKAGMPRLEAVVLANGIIEEKRRALNPAAPPATSPDAVLADIRASIVALAESGNVRAMLHLAEAFRGGKGAELDPQRSKAWLDRATASIDPVQRFDAAYALQFGRIVPRDQERAARLYAGIADTGQAAAQNNLGNMLRNGHGLATDKIEALKWFILSAKAGNKLAEKNRDSLSAELADDERGEAERRAGAWKPVAQAAR